MGGEDNNAGLTFHWERDGVRSPLRLAGFVFLSIFVHAGFFYLFRVVYPASDRVLPTPVSVVLLPAEMPDVQPVLRMLDDRSAAYSSAGSASVSSGLDLGNYASVYADGEESESSTDYVPTYGGYDPLLMRWPGVEAGTVLPPLIEGGETAILPVADGAVPENVPPTQGAGGGAPASASVTVFPGGSLEGRGVAVMPEVDPSAWAGSGNGRVVLMVGVDRGGRVRYVVPTDRGGLPELGAVSSFAGQVVFEPAPPPSSELEWGTLEVVW